MRGDWCRSLLVKFWRRPVDPVGFSLLIPGNSCWSQSYRSLWKPISGIYVLYRNLYKSFVYPQNFMKLHELWLLVGGLEHEFYFSIQLGMSLSQFFRGVGLNHKPDYHFPKLWSLWVSWYHCWTHRRQVQDYGTLLLGFLLLISVYRLPAVVEGLRQERQADFVQRMRIVLGCQATANWARK